ncbi:HTATSF1 [Branchiostoma lanceolatum]|uniref:HTATSF1 protein n=1 Tax=Branchiostoma lanceolatum TaxID=7740 RepID=A0A8J9YJ53_BRALA|nr:HTATSF1 [Branchiostoma lanceolatum]
MAAAEEDFEFQLQQEEIQQHKREHGDPFTYTDPDDGTVYEWDQEKLAWFPKITDDFIAAYQANYGVTDATQQQTASTTQQTQQQQQQKKVKKELKPGEKRKANDPEWFDVDEVKNTNVYVSGLPTDITDDEFKDLMQKCGIIMEDAETGQPKFKLYRDQNGQLKGDGRCCYLKRESVELALQILDNYEFRSHTIHVEPAKFQLKGAYNPALKKKKKKKQKKEKNMQERLLDWRPERKEPLRPKHERVMIIRNMFHPKDFEEDPLVLNEISDDLREECEKFGIVKKVLLFDRHPDGVASVAFKEAEMADAAVAALNARWFGGRQLNVALWDGVTDYQIQETDREREERLKKWEEFLDKGADIKKEVTTEATTSTTTTAASSSTAGESDRGKTEG